MDVYSFVDDVVAGKLTMRKLVMVLAGQASSILLPLGRIFLHSWCVM
jgi:hypothetical protein